LRSRPCEDGGRGKKRRERLGGDWSEGLSFAKIVGEGRKGKTTVLSNRFAGKFTGRTSLRDLHLTKREVCQVERAKQSKLAKPRKDRSTQQVG